MPNQAFTVHPIRPLSTFAEPGEQDASLVRDCQSGNKAAWEALIQRYTRHIYGLCYRFTGRDCDARDVMQEVFLRVFCKLGSFRANQQLSFVAWLTSLTHNVLVDHYRRNRNKRLAVSIEEKRPRIQSFTQSIDSPDRILAERETRELLQSALLKLAPNLREVVILSDLQEIRHRDIALALGIPEGTVKSRLSRGRSTLARLLSHSLRRRYNVNSAAKGNLSRISEPRFRGPGSGSRHCPTTR
jgi:RNA polymerase sigma-70 factor, ECF subfamily